MPVNQNTDLSHLFLSPHTKELLFCSSPFTRMWLKRHILKLCIWHAEPTQHNYQAILNQVLSHISLYDYTKIHLLFSSVTSSSDFCSRAAQAYKPISCFWIQAQLLAIIITFFLWKIKEAPVRSLRKKLTRNQVARNSSRPQFTAFHKFLKPFATLRFLCYPAQQYSTATGFRWQWMLTSCVLLTAIPTAVKASGISTPSFGHRVRCTHTTTHL